MTPSTCAAIVTPYAFVFKFGSWQKGSKTDRIDSRHVEENRKSVGAMQDPIAGNNFQRDKHVFGIEAGLDLYTQNLTYRGVTDSSKNDWIFTLSARYGHELKLLEQPLLACVFVGLTHINLAVPGLVSQNKGKTGGSISIRFETVKTGSGRWRFEYNYSSFGRLRYPQRFGHPPTATFHPFGHRNKS